MLQIDLTNAKLQPVSPQWVTVNTASFYGLNEKDLAKSAAMACVLSPLNRRSSNRTCERTNEEVILWVSVHSKLYITWSRGNPSVTTS